MPVTISGTTGGIGLIGSDTAKATTSGTSVDFTGIPAGVKRVTVMFNGVSTNGTSFKQIQIGSSTFTTTGYISSSTSGGSTTSSTTGFLIRSNVATETISGIMILTNISGNIWISSHSTKIDTGFVATGGGDVSISGTLDRVRITTVNGTDTFDAGSANILYE
jgi:hypothetical protein